MNSEEIQVFFYGLFMDSSVLASKGVIPSRATLGYVDGYGLRIGKRATLIRDDGNRAHGVVATLRAEDLQSLYADESVADYVPEAVTVALPGGAAVTALCYNLPISKLQGVNPEYAKSLWTLAAKLGLPEDYLEHIRVQGTGEAR